MELASNPSRFIFFGASGKVMNFWSWNTMVTESILLLLKCIIFVHCWCNEKAKCIFALEDTLRAKALYGPPTLHDKLKFNPSTSLSSNCEKPKSTCFHVHQNGLFSHLGFAKRVRFYRRMYKVLRKYKF